MEMTKLKVTPAIAKEWLDTANHSNRRLSRHNVIKFAADMRDGNWQDTHQNVIAFYEDGTLADGQHRLAAVVMSGVPVSMFVASGLSKKDGGMIDQGRTRSVADALKIGGLISSDKYTSYAVAIVKLIRSAECRNNNGFSIAQTAKAIEDMQDGIEFACRHTTSMKGIGLKNATMRAAVAVAFYHVDQALLERFCRVMVSGMPEGSGDEMLIRFRNWLIVLGATKGGTDRIVRYQTILKIIDAYNKGINLSRIHKASGNTFETGLFND